MRPLVRQIHAITLEAETCDERIRARRTDSTALELAKSTDENLTSEDWAAIMEVCDRVSSDENGSQAAVQGLIKRLAHRNANVQLYTLEVRAPLSRTGRPAHCSHTIRIG